MSSYHVVVAVDKAHVKQTHAPKVLREGGLDIPPSLRVPGLR